MMALIVIQEMCARMGVVTGKGLSDLIREKFGAKITFYLMIGMFLTNMGNVISEFAGVAAGMEVFGVHKFTSVPFSAFLARWMRVYREGSLVEKGVKLEEYKFARFDVVVGSIIVHILAFLIILVCAETLFKNGIRIETAKDAALSLKPLAGKYCTFLFAFGLVNASLFAASILPLSTPSLICEGLGWEGGMDKKLVEAPQFYGFYSLIIFLGAGIVLYPNFPLIPIMYFSQVINGM